MSAIGKSLPFTKMQAVGNDFVVVETPRLPVAVDLGALAIRLCDRHQGVGSDGLLAVGPSERADFRMRMFNPDGTEDMCGNGLRCSVRFVREHGLAAGATGTAECLDGLHAYEVNGDAITVAMARPEFALTDIPVDLDEYDGPRSTSHLGLRVRELGVDVNLDATNTGSTHSVIWCDTLPTNDVFREQSPIIENARLFPERTSVLWAMVEAPDTLRLRIWERGAGETLGCGTGACAAAVLARVRSKIVTPAVRVISRGGTLTVRWDGGAISPIYLTGDAQTVFTGTFTADA
jgi:diaminopimelate epimerase